MSDPQSPAASDPKAEQLAQQYGIAPVSDEVKRLAELVSRRESWGEDIAKIVEKDVQMTGKLVKIANPRATKASEYRFTTTQDCVGRVGMNSVLLLAMTGPLLQAVTRTFSTMLATELKQAEANEIKPFEAEHILGEVAFAGSATGTVQLRLMPATSLVIAARMLGLTVEELAAMGEEVDVVGEICNMIAGNFKSNLCDAQLDCRISPPKITTSSNFTLVKPAGHVADRFGFHAPQIELFVDLSINPKGT